MRLLEVNVYKNNNRCLQGKLSWQTPLIRNIDGKMVQINCITIKHFGVNELTFNEFNDMFKPKEKIHN